MLMQEGRKLIAIGHLIQSGDIKSKCFLIYLEILRILTHLTNIYCNQILQNSPSLSINLSYDPLWAPPKTLTCTKASYVLYIQRSINHASTYRLWPVPAYACATKSLTCSKSLTFFSIQLQWLRPSIKACLVNQYMYHKIHHTSKFGKDWTSNTWQLWSSWGTCF